MGSVTTPGDLAGLVLLAAAVLTAAGRVAAGLLAASHAAEHARRFSLARSPEQRPPARQPPTGYHQPQPQPPALALHVIGPSQPSMLAQPNLVIPPQSTWQCRASQPAGLIEDRIPGPAALQLEETVGSRDQ